MESNTHIQGYEGYVRDEDGHNTLSVKVGGVHCAGCIQKIESALTADDAVDHARLNFSTGTLRIEWHGDALRANDYVQMVSDLGYTVNPYDVQDNHEADENKFLLLCMGVSGFAAGNIMLLSFGLWITNMQTMGIATREFLHLVSALIAIPAIMFSGRPFSRSAWSALKNKRTNMDVPISLALVLATGMSIHELWRGAEHVYFDSALMLCFFLLIGRYLDFRVRAKARSAATDLMSTLQGFATIIEGTKSRKIPIKDVRPGMIVQVAVGEKVPVDGVVSKGQTDIDMSLVTGETKPAYRQSGDDVYAGTLNLLSPFEMMVTKPASDSLLADIVRLMEKAEQGQAAYTRVADRAARLYTPVVHTLALAAFVLWFGFLGASWQDALLISVTVLIITCPCALGLAVPVAQVLAISRLMTEKILVKSGDALERLASVTSVFLDKTGTLTKGTPRLIGDYDAEDLKLAASIARHSSHPYAKAISRSYDGDLYDIDDVREIAGQGMEGQFKGERITLGRPDGGAEQASLWLRIGAQDPVCFVLEDELRPHALETIDYLQSHHMHVTLISGDRDQVAQRYAAQVHIENAKGDLKPNDKYDYIDQANKGGAKTLMIGDGLNDAPVLAVADISMAPGTAIDMAQNVADIVFMGEGFDAVRKAHETSMKTQKIIQQNFAISVLYNLIAVPIAFMGMVTPMIAAIAMSGSSILVILNSLRLKLRS